MMEYTLFGESHGAAVGVLLRNVPTGIPVDEAFIAAELLRRAPCDALATGRRETDSVEFLSGVFEGKTTGTPLAAILRNMDVRSEDYAPLRHTPRPSHADYTAWVKYGGCNDYRGGGHFSGRLTAPLTVAGAIAKTYLKSCGVEIRAEVIDEEDLRRRASAAKAEGDSVGGQLRCTVTGMPVGVGGPDYENALESEISRHVFAVPAVKAIGFGAGERFAAMRGSEANDPLRVEDGKVIMSTNNAGGINGGISNGMPLVFTVTFRPTPSIAKPQNSVDLEQMRDTVICIGGRHDAAVVLRAAPAIEAATALALCQLIEPSEQSLTALRGELDVVDIKLTALLEKRLRIASAIGQVKRERGLPIIDAAREAEVLRSRVAWLPEKQEAVETFFTTLMRLSREEEHMKNLVLIGLPGCGKSTVGRLAAAELGLVFTDCDAAVEKRTGMAVAEIFARDGEDAFREIESEVLADILAKSGQVVAAGGGVVLRRENREALKSAAVLFIDRTPDDIMSTCDMAGRPLLRTKSLPVLSAERRGLYLACADEVITAENIEEITAKVVEYRRERM